MSKPNEENQHLLKILDDISELIYISDFETYDILYLNSSGMKQFDLKQNSATAKCYETLQGRNAPCPFCTNKFLVEGEDYRWNHRNLVTDRYYLLKDRLIWWNGRKARLEIAFDMTDIQNEKLALQYALDTEKMILACIKILTDEKDVTESINTAVRMVGEHLFADRAFIFELKDNKIYNTFEWCKEGVKAQQNQLQDLDISIIDTWKEAFKNQQCVVFEDIETIEDKKLYNILYPQGIKSLVITSLEQNGEQIGYFGLDNPPVEKIQNIAALLETLRYFIIMTIQKKSDELLLEKLSIYDTLTGLYNRNKYILDVSILSKTDASLGVLYLDVNGLKELNDQRGHSFGDYVLKRCALKIKSVFEKANIYRTGGDEFIIICEMEDEKKLLTLCEKLKRQFAEDEYCSVAIGYRWTKTPAALEKVIEEADNSMYEDKKRHYKNSGILENKRYREARNFRCEVDGFQ